MTVAASGKNHIDALLYNYTWSSTPGTPSTLTYAFNTSAGLRPSAAVKDAYVSATKQWENVANVKFVVGAESTAKIIFGKSDLDDDGAAGIMRPSVSGGRLVKARVEIDDDYNTAAEVAKGTFGYKVLLHEIGHAIGLKHPGNYGNTSGTALPSDEDTMNASIMSYYSSSIVDRVHTPPVGPQIYDIAAVQYLYGANHDYKAGNTIWSINGRANAQTIWDGGGNDTIDASTYKTATKIDLNEGLDNYSHIGNTYVWVAFGAKIENAIGGSKGDTILGNKFANLLEGNGGADSLSGGSGNDTLYGGNGNDTLRGGAGRDTLKGEADNDTIYGGDDNDSLYGGGGNNKLDGGDGNDKVNGGSGVDWLTGDKGNDTLSGGNDLDKLYGGDDSDILKGEGGNDLLRGGNGKDAVYGGDGNDSLKGDADNDTIYGGDGTDTLFGGDHNDLLYGQNGNDTLYGEDGNDKMYGDDGNDSMIGGTGNDSLIGDNGGDTLYGGDGNDYIFAGTGNDTLYGGGNADTFYFNYAGGAGLDRIEDFQGAGVAGGDIIKLASLGNYTDLNDLVDSITYGGGNSVIHLDGGKDITLAGVSTHLVVGDFLIG